MKTRLIQIIALLVVIALAGCDQEEGTRQAERQPDPPAQSASEPVDDEQPCQLTVGWDPWEPYHYLAAGGELQGLDVEIIERLADAADCELEFLQGSWEGLLRLLKVGDVDVMTGATRTASREEFARFSDPYRTDTFRLFVLASHADQYQDRALGSLLDDGFRIGVTQGYYYGDETSKILDREEYNDQIVAAAVGELNITRLIDYQIDGFLEDPFVFAAFERRRQDAGQITALDASFGGDPVTLMFSRASVDAETVERFNAALAELRESGKHRELLDEYLE